jgi:hypothetical protein
MLRSSVEMENGLLAALVVFAADGSVWWMDCLRCGGGIAPSLETHGPDSCTQAGSVLLHRTAFDRETSQLSRNGAAVIVMHKALYGTAAKRKQRTLPEGSTNGQIDPLPTFLVSPGTDGIGHGTVVPE